ncbi:MarR family winged helix-turn-helix transcriptional regulator [Noviherbaspirillum suwonense]|uniref:DNA-binding transcriptional regulator, MarR family n=1 Tax=Noviherbaspirillum suwonense TaxID=1224511 RepID=A0ABY1QRK6_9BURK|nr:MarR family winged helix-turn-helix transcriptional regulator [Noviherbaspirillum suwonense]SMP78909.1 DNA-binding transcriptional regulator, MarR family [Noviherbaspirillum suwonense]
MLDLNRYVPALLVWVSNKLSSSASQRYRQKFDLGVTDWRVLAYIELYPWSTGSEVCQLIGLDKGAVSRSLTCLDGMGLVEARPFGLRKIQYATTEAGKAMYSTVLETALAREEALLSGFSDAERDLMIKFLHRLLSNLPAVEAVARSQDEAD